MNYRAVGSSKVGKRSVSRLAAFGLVMALIVALAVALPARAQSSPPAWAHTGTPSTGVAVVDAVIDRVLAADANGLRELLSFVEAECSNAPGLGGVPCPDGVEEGTAIEVIFSGGCEVQGVTESELSPDALTKAARPGLFLYAAGRVTPATGPWAVDYLLFFSTAADPGTVGAVASGPGLPVVLGLTDAGLRSLSNGCSGSVADAAENPRVTQWLLAPKSAGASTPTVTSTPKVPSVGSGNADAVDRAVPLLFVAGAGLVAAAAFAAFGLRRR